MAKKRGCFFWGCAGCGCLVVVLIVAVGLTGFFSWKWVDNNLASTTPLAMERGSYSQEEAAAVLNKVNEFKMKMEEGVAGKLELTDREINILVEETMASDPKFGEVIRAFHCDIEEGMATVDVSVYFFKRYFNFHVKGTGQAVGGDAHLDVREFRIGALDMPDEQMGEISRNMEMQIKTNPDLKKNFDKIDRLDLAGDRVIIQLKGAPDRPAGANL